MALVKLILREDLGKLGDAGDVVSVKPGYARNYLLKRGMATLATEARIQEVEHHRRAIEMKQAKEMKDLELTKRSIESVAVEVAASAGTGGKLFGSVTMQQVAQLLALKGIEIDRRKLSVTDVIKTTGEHVVTVHLRRQLTAALKVVVTSSLEAPPEAVIEADSDDSLGVMTDAERSRAQAEATAARLAKAAREEADED